jgi:hypothetical protein
LLASSPESFDAATTWLTVRLKIMSCRTEFEGFSVIGGPVYRLGCRLGLVRGETNTIAIGIALGGFLWAVQLALFVMDGMGNRSRRYIRSFSYFSSCTLRCSWDPC